VRGKEEKGKEKRKRKTRKTGGRFQGGPYIRIPPLSTLLGRGEKKKQKGVWEKRGGERGNRGREVFVYACGNLLSRP